jgi:hypothetical protein
MGGGRGEEREKGFCSGSENRGGVPDSLLNIRAYTVHCTRVVNKKRTEEQSLLFVDLGIIFLYVN